MGGIILCVLGKYTACVNFVLLASVACLTPSTLRFVCFPGLGCLGWREYLVYFDFGGAYREGEWNMNRGCIFDIGIG